MHCRNRPPHRSKTAVGERHLHNKIDFAKEFERYNISSDLDIADIAKNPEVHEIISNEINLVNSKLAKFETVKEYLILPLELTPDNYLTPSLKVKKKLLLKDFAKEIDAMYHD